MQIVMEAAALEQFLHREFPQVAGDFCGIEVTPEGLRLRLSPKEQHLRPGGTISGPSLFALADVGAYLAILSRIGPVALAVTTNASVDFMRKPPAGGVLVADLEILKLGRSLAVVDAKIRAEGAAPILARATLTYSLPKA